MHQRPVQTIKILSAAGILCLLIAAVMEYFPSGSSVEWVPFESAFRRARAENKLVYVDVYAEWCGPCKTMDRTTFSNDTVISALKNDLIAVRVNIDDPEIGADIKKRFSISAMPTSLLLRHDQFEVKRRVGYMNAGTMMDWLADTVFSEFLQWSDFSAASALARSGKKNIFIVVLHDSLKVMEMQRAFQNKNIKQMIKKDFIPVLLVNSIPDHRTIIQQYTLLPSNDFIGGLFTFTSSMELIRTIPLRNFDAMRLQPLVEQVTAR
jgi:thioredoxin 1